MSTAAAGRCCITPSPCRRGRRTGSGSPSTAGSRISWRGSDDNDRPVPGRGGGGVERGGHPGRPPGPGPLGFGPHRRPQHHRHPGGAGRPLLRRLRRPDRRSRCRHLAGLVQLSGHGCVGPLSGAGPAVRIWIVATLALIGLFFSLSGAVGIVRMPDVYCRIQCSSKTVTMGALPALIALVVGEGPITNYGGRALLIAVLLLVVNQVASHSLARAAYKT